MTVTGMTAQQPTTLSLLHKLLAQDHLTSGGQDRAPWLSTKINTAVSALTSTPVLCSLALEVVSSAVLSLCPLQLELSSPPPQIEGPLATTLQGLWTLLDSLYAHNPQGWSIKLFKWCVSLLGRVSTTCLSSTCLEEALRKLLTSPLLSPLLDLLNKCTGHLVLNGCGLECMQMLLPACNLHAPHLNWLLAHIMSLHPSQLIALLLDHTLSSGVPASDPCFATLTKVFAYMARTHRHALKACVVEKLMMLIGVGGGMSERGGGLVKLFVLLSLATNCRALLDVVAEELLDIVTAEKLMALVKENLTTPTSKNLGDMNMSDQNDEDEGEILSDEETMETGGTTSSDAGPSVGVDQVVMVVCELICQLPGRQACIAMGVAFDMYMETKQLLKAQEECIEEGEIVRESGVHLVITVVEQMLTEILSRLHVATGTPHLTPGGGGSGKGLEFAVGMQEGLDMWCGRMLALFQQKEKERVCVCWLQEIVTYVGLSCSELKVARSLAYLLTHAHLPTQLPPIVSIFKDVQARHFSLARCTLQHCITITQQPLSSSSPVFPIPIMPSSSLLSGGKGMVSDSVDASSLLTNFASSMLIILQGGRGEGPHCGAAVDHMTRSQFWRALTEQLLPLTQLLSQAVLTAAPSMHQIILILDLMRCVIEHDWSDAEEGEWPCLSTQSHGRVLHEVLAQHFSLMKILAHSIGKSGHVLPSIETALGKSLWLISWCTRTTPSVILVPHSNINMSKEDSNLCTGPAGSARMMAYNIVMETVLSKEMKMYFSASTDSSSPQLSEFTPRAGSDLLLENFSLPTQLSVPSLLGKREFSLPRSQQHTDAPKTDKSCSCLTGHLTQLLLAIGPSLSSNHTERELAMVLLDNVAPQFVAELKVWPDAETLKYSQERDLTIKRMFDSNPVLWHFLHLISEPHSSNELSALIVCAPIVRSLLTVLTQHWQRCRIGTITMFPWELRNTISLVECLAKALWIRPPLVYVGELFPHLSPPEISTLLSAINSFIKLNFDSIRSGHQPESEDGGSCNLVKGVLLHHMQHFGHLYARLVLFEQDQK